MVLGKRRARDRLAGGDTVELYAQWKKTAAQRPVVDSDPVDPAEPFDPDAPPAELDELFA